MNHHCACQKGCKDSRCGCRRLGSKCTEACKCSSCCNVNSISSSSSTSPHTQTQPPPLPDPPEADIVAPPPPPTDEVLQLTAKLIRWRRAGPIISRIPKAARQPAAEALTTIIKECIAKNDTAAWSNLLCFAYVAFTLPEKTNKKKQSLATVIKNNIKRTDVPERAITRRQTPATSDAALKSRVDKKFMEADISGVIRTLMSDDKLAEHTPETLLRLREKHPLAVTDAVFPPEPNPSIAIATVTTAEIRQAILSFPNGSAGGLDGLKAQHLKDLTSYRAAISDELCAALAELIDLMLRGGIVGSVCPLVYGANLTALQKLDGGVRPIAVGNTLRRLVGKIVSQRVVNDLAAGFRPTQLGCGTAGGAEAVVHAVRDFCSRDPENVYATLKIDFANAFNAVRRDKLLSAVKDHMPLYYNFIWQMYRNPSSLFYGDSTISSECGVQQGDPLGPLLFCLVTNSLCRARISPLNVWYLDDGTIGGPVDTVIEDFRSLVEEAAEVGLKLNYNKCEIYLFGGSQVQRDDAANRLAEVSPDFRFLTAANFALLGSPLLRDSIESAINAKIHSIKVLTRRLNILDAHHALFLLKSCLGASRVQYLLRTSCSWLYPEKLQLLDDVLRDAVSTVVNINMTDAVWMQAALPVNCGGLGIRQTAELAISAYLASVHAARALVSSIIVDYDWPAVVADPIGLWLGEKLPTEAQRSIQRAWDRPIVEQKYEVLLRNANSTEKARLMAVSTKEAGSWLQVLPSAPLGTLLDNDTLRISVALRLGAQVCYEHECRCGELVDELGRHGLRCKKSAGRFSRHAALNDIVCRSLCTAGTPAVVEPPGLARNDGKRPDGVTRFPWKNGKSLVWDSTCVDTLAHEARSVASAGTAADDAEKAKVAKYDELVGRFLFVPLGFETFGSMGPSARAFVDELGRRIQQASGEQRSTQFLKQRLSLAIQRGNAVAVMGTREAARGLDEVFFVLNTRSKPGQAPRVETFAQPALLG